MTVRGTTGNVLGDLAGDEHHELGHAKRVLETGLDSTGTTFVSPTMFNGSAGVGKGVVVIDPTTGSPLSVTKNPTTFYLGGLASSEIQLYVVPTGKKAWITSIDVRNTNAIAQTVVIGIRAPSVGTTITPWADPSLSNGQAFKFVDEDPIALTAGYSIRGSTTTNNATHCFISGELLDA